MRQVDVAAVAVENTTGAHLVLLREQDEPHRVLPVFVGAAEAVSIGVAISGKGFPRPMTHDLMAALVQSLDAQLVQVEVTEIRDSTFFAELELAGPGGRRRVDARPSDAVALAVRLGAPVFVSEAVLDQAAGRPAEQDIVPLDEEAIEEQLAEFRSELESVDLSDLESGGDSGPRPGRPGDRPGG
jgi:bifunctional DNase/RNase